MLREHHYGDQVVPAGYRFEDWCRDLGLFDARNDFDADDLDGSG